MQENKQEKSPIKKRILQYLELKGISKYSFYKESYVTRGVLDQDTGISEDNLAKFLAYAQDISPIWVLTGEGEIFLTKTPKFLTNSKGKELGKELGKIRKLQNSLPITEESLIPTASDVVLDHRFPLRSDHIVEEQRVPLYDLEASAGLESLFVDTHLLTPSSYITLPDLPPCDGALHVWGDSMYPLLKSGDIVLYRQVRNIADGILWGEMYLVSITVDDDEMIAVKYIQKGKDAAHVVLASQNEFYSPKEVPLSSIRALALIKASVRYNTMG